VGLLIGESNCEPSGWMRSSERNQLQRVLTDLVLLSALERSLAREHLEEDRKVAGRAAD
jgi:hypothetical protein